ncbi:hypothetical protein BpHYR1_020306 [Brachionus plicatilis]|uniref:Ig-like domain-containing protein n=1 Tax=Brachionus plicatilis TaxID=10195 RepID=A0A3M7RCL3_BRAPC|nr:hypothetical protein BpHYR1_020306 [Brachionus plicatilis]
MKTIIEKFFSFFLVLYIKPLNADNLIKTAGSDFKLFEPSKEFQQRIENKEFVKNTVLTVYAQTGENVVLKCKSKEKKSQIFWFRHSTEVELLNNNTFYGGIKTNREFILIQNFQIQDSGIYFCIQYKFVDSSYHNISEIPAHLIQNLLKSDQNFKLEFLVTELQSYKRVYSFPIDQSTSPFESESRPLIDNNLEVFYEWTDWTQCRGSCDSKTKLGLKSKRGNCYIRLRNGQKVNNSLLARLDDIFGNNGWSCHLSVHYSFLSLKFLAKDHLKDCIKYQKCKINCLDNRENLKNEINRMFKTDREYKIDDPKKMSDFDVSKFFKIPFVDIRGIKNEKLKISCLEFKIGIDLEIKWTKNDNPVEDSLLNEMNEIVFKKLKYSDSGRFDCYLNDMHIVQYNLRIHSKNESRRHSKEFDKYNDLILKIICLICILIVFQMMANILYSLCLEKKRIEILKKSKNFNNLSKFLGINLEILEKSYLNDFEAKKYVANEDYDSDSIEDDESVLNDTQITD